MEDDNSQWRGWGMNTCMVAEEIGFGAKIPHKYRVSCSNQPEIINAGGPVALPNYLNGSFVKFDGQLVRPSQERQSSDGASNCVKVATCLSDNSSNFDFSNHYGASHFVIRTTGLSGSASNFDFANRDGFKIESSVESSVEVSSSLDHINEPQNAFRSIPFGVGISGRFDPVGYSDDVQQGISTIDYWHTPLQFHFFSHTRWEAGSEDEDDEMKLDTLPLPSRMGDTYECKEFLTKAEIGSLLTTHRSILKNHHPLHLGW